MVSWKRARPRLAIEAVVEMNGLGRLAGIDADRLAGGQQVAGLEEAVEQGEQPGLGGQILEHLAARSAKGVQK